MLIETEVWCTAQSHEMISMGIPEGDQWMPMTIDFNSVVAIKLSGGNEFLGDNKAVVYLKNDNFTINMTYAQAVEIWKKVYANTI